MGLSFPAGTELEKAALESRKTFKPKPCVKGTDCCLSGIENKCLDMIKSGESKRDVALFCLDSVAAALEKMTENIIKKYGRLPLVFAGGVMSNSIIRRRFTEEFGAYFAEPAFSADNAAGTAYLTYPVSAGITVTNSRGFSPHSTCKHMAYANYPIFIFYHDNIEIRNY